MNGNLLDLSSTAAWVLKDFWLSLAISVVLLAIRAFKGSTSLGDQSQITAVHRDRVGRWSSSASAVPILFWALEANELQRLVYGTHASTQPVLLLASMQEILGAVVLVTVILGLDFLGRFLESQRRKQPIVPLPAGVALLLVLVLSDWLLSQIGWWALITKRTTLPP